MGDVGNGGAAVLVVLGRRLLDAPVQLPCRVAAGDPQCHRGVRGATQYQPDVRHYALVGESLFFEWRDQGARLADLLDYARIRPAASREAQVTFDFSAGATVTN